MFGGDAETGKVLKPLVKSDATCLLRVKNTIKNLGVDNSLAKTRRLQIAPGTWLLGSPQIS